MIDAGLIAAVYRIPRSQAKVWATSLDEAVKFAELNTDNRIADFLAQIGHESGRLRYTAEIWGPTAQQVRYERDFRYAWTGKRGTKNALAFNLGNQYLGDGSKYRGHGFIQVTGRTNTSGCTVRLRKALGASVPDFVAVPARLREPYWAAISAADFWRNRNLNAYSDSGDFAGQTRRINGGYNGIADRQALRTQFLILMQG